MQYDIAASYFFCLFNLSVFAQESDTKISIIPEPVELTRTEGFFRLPEEISIKSAASAEILHTANFLKDRLITSTGNKVSISQTEDHPTIRLQMNAEEDLTLGEEGYRLIVNPKSIVIKANKPAGLFYGAQSLLQLFPKEIESDKVSRNVK